MVRIDLSTEDAGVLSRALESYLSELGMEIAGTDRMDFREGLKAERQVLMRVLDDLRTAS